MTRNNIFAEISLLKEIDIISGKERPDHSARIKMPAAIENNRFFISLFIPSMKNNDNITMTMYGALEIKLIMFIICSIPYSKELYRIRCEK